MSGDAAGPDDAPRGQGPGGLRLAAEVVVALAWIAGSWDVVSENFYLDGDEPYPGFVYPTLTFVPIIALFAWLTSHIVGPRVGIALRVLVAAGVVATVVAAVIVLNDPKG
jgi:hypothetical protein